MTYEVSLSRISTATKIIAIEADSQEEAEAKALELAPAEDFTGFGTGYEYEVNNTTEAAF